MTHVLISFCNVRVPRAPRLGLLDLNTSELKVLALPQDLEVSRGITGLALSDDYLFAAANPSSLFVFERRCLKLQSRYDFERGRDVHSLWAEGDRVWAVSTGTDEVLELAVQAGQILSEKVAWRPDEAGPRKDVHHLNAIRRHEGRLIVSAFGRKASELWVSASQGFVQDIERDEQIVSSLDHPHSLEVLDGNLLLCESRKMIVRTGDGEASKRVEGYTRGLCIVDNGLLVGASKGRLVSKSADVINNPSEPGEAAGSCSITRLSAKTWDVEEVIDATSLGREIYDLVPVEGVDNWPILSDTDWHETTLRELWETMDRSDAEAKRAKRAGMSQQALLDEANREHELERARAEERAANREQELKRETVSIKERVAALEQELDSRMSETQSLQHDVVRLSSSVNAREQQLERVLRRGATHPGGRWVTRILRPLRAAYRFLSWIMRPTPARRRFVREYLSLRDSEDFDPDFYLAAYPDVRRAGWDPLMHYIEHGWRRGNDPSARFSTSGYLADRPDAEKAGLNPLLHYLKHERAADRSIAPATSREAPKPGANRDSRRSGAPERVNTSPASSNGSSRGRAKVSVVCWDMGHNPLGRAYLLADALSRSFDVQIVGAQFPRYGTKVWAPLRDSAISMRTFSGTAFPDHFERMEQMARRLDGDIILAAKPRLPSYELAILAKEAMNRPLILDIDDRELSFFSQSTGLTLSEVDQERADPDYLLPFGRLWTQYCETTAGSADGTIVSNSALQDVYGGAVIPHARDERVFDPSLYDRDALRARFGFDRDDRVILFVGTPRAHKGVLELVDALQELPDRRTKLCIIGSVTDADVKRRLDALGDQRIVLVGDRPLSELPQHMMMGDLVCLIQDPTSEIAQYQMPAKFTDALAMGVPMLGTRVPPLLGAMSQGLIQPLDTDSLADQIADSFERQDERRAQALENRQHFLREYSYAAANRQLGDLIDDLGRRPVPFGGDFEELLDYHRSRFRSAATPPVTTARVRRSPTGTGPMSNALRQNGKEARRGTTSSRARRGARDEPIDLVFFWRQNDSGIYGRRSDMLVKHLASSPRVGQIVHFDAPIAEDQLRTHQDRGADPTDHGSLIVKNTLRRAQPGRRRGKVKEHVFVYGRPDGKAREPARDLKGLGPFPSREMYPRFVEAVLRSYGVGARRSVFWDCPIDYNFPQLTRMLQPDIVVADVIDDGREFLPAGSPERLRATQNYRDVLGLSDLVLTNCRPAQESMGEFADTVHMLPNASEPLRTPLRVRPRELRALKGPLIGYVGNLSSRIDIDLLEHVARTRPRWQLVLLGSTHVSRSVLRLREHPNVHFLGVKAYPKVRRYIAAFDVALVPHLDDAMTQSMNPLKVFVYASLGVPIVSTAVSNVDELRPLIRSASTPDGFVQAVEEALRAGHGITPEGRQLLTEHSWARRVEHILDLLDETLTGKGVRLTSTR